MRFIEGEDTAGTSAVGCGRRAQPLLRTRRAGILSFVELAKRHELVLNFGRESASASASVDQQFVQIGGERNVVPPQPRDSVRNSGQPLQQRKRLDSRWQACRPLCRGGQELVQRLQPAPVPEFGGRIQRCSLASAVSHRGSGDWQSTSEIAEHQLEFDVAIEHRPAVHPADADEADVQRVFIGADFRHAGQVVLDRKTQQLRHLRGRQHQLEDAAIRDLLARAAVVAKEPQDDCQAVVDRQERLEPRLQVILPRGRVGIEPVVVRRQVELADAAGDCGALLDRHQPFVLAQMRSGAARLAEQRAARPLDVGEQRLEDARLDRRIVAQRDEQLLLPLELLQDVGLQVGARRDVGDLEQRKQCRVVIRAPRCARRRIARAGIDPRVASACECARSTDARSGSRQGLWGRLLSRHSARRWRGAPRTGRQ